MQALIFNPIRAVLVKFKQIYVTLLSQKVARSEGKTKRKC